MGCRGELRIPEPARTGSHQDLQEDLANQDETRDVRVEACGAGRTGVSSTNWKLPLRLRAGVLL